MSNEAYLNRLLVYIKAFYFIWVFGKRKLSYTFISFLVVSVAYLAEQFHWLYYFDFRNHIFREICKIPSIARGLSICVCVCVCMCTCMCMHMCVCVCVCVYAYVCITFIRIGHILAKIKNVKNDIYRFDIYHSLVS